MAYTRALTNISPYWDDYASYRNFLRILYKPSFPVQARELTQMQTAAQRQIEHVAQHLFADGSPIIGARVEVTDNAPYIEILASNIYILEDASPTTPISAISELVGQHIQSWTVDPLTTSGTMALIRAADNNAGTVRLQLDYRGGKFAVAGQWASVDYYDDDASNWDAPTSGVKGYKYQSDGTTGISAIGSGLRARVESGVVWINGFFVEIQEQEIFVNKQNTNGTYLIGYEYEEVTLTEADTGYLDPVDGATILADTIRDPANSSNNDAPGADRYMVLLNLTFYDITDPDNILDSDGNNIGNVIPDNFHQIIRIANGVVEEKIDKVEYDEILDLLADRTYDESGSYTIEPYSLLAEDAAPNFNYVIGPGHSYIFGYERENIAPVRISATKTRTTRDLTSVGAAISALYGTYVIQRTAPAARTFDGTDVEVGPADTVTLSDHGFAFGEKVVYTDGTGSITGLTTGTDYWIIRYSKDVFAFASSPTNATAGTKLPITGSGTGHTLTPQEQLFGDIDSTAYDTMYLMSGVNGTGDWVGTVKVWFADSVANKLRLYIGDNTELVADLAGTGSLCSVNTGNPTDGTDLFMNIAPFDNSQVVGYNVPLVELYPHTKQVQSANYPTLLRVSKSVVTNTQYSITLNANDKFPSDPYNAIAFVLDSAGNLVDHTAGDGAFGTAPTGGGTNTITTGGAEHDLTTGTYVFYLNINRESDTPGTKVLTQQVVNITTNVSAGLTELIFNGTDNNGDLTAATASRFDVAFLESVVRDPGGADEDVTANFTLNTGQKDLYYDYSSVSGVFADNESYAVTIQYWDWTSPKDFFAANSYTVGANTYLDDKGGVFANIGTYTNKNKTKTWALRDVMDFRRAVTTLTTPKEITAPTGTVTAFYEYYLPRMDKVWIDKEGRFGVSQGVPEELPRLPPDKSGTVTLFTVYLGPYIYSPYDAADLLLDSEEVNIRMVEHRNYTMDDIRRLENRIRSLEAYTSENQLELDSYADTVFDINGLSRAKNGIFVDKFNSHIKGSVYETGYRCSMDPNQGALHCPFEMNHIQFEYDNDSATVALQTNNSEKLSPWVNTITLGVSSTPMWIEQPLASEFMNINPFAVIVWSGEMKMQPHSDTWIETRYAPTLQIQDPDESGKIRALYVKPNAGVPMWNAWMNELIGVDSRILSVWDRRTSNAERLATGFLRVEGRAEEITTRILSRRTGSVIEETGHRTITRDMGERTVDISKIPWMRKVNIQFEAFGLRPETIMVPYFADVDVSSNVTWDAGNPGGKTTKSGYLKGTFTVPTKTFKTGKNSFVVKDATFNPLSVAATEFRAEGTLFTKQKQILSVEVPTYTTRAIQESVERAESQQQETITRWYDPIAQTFLVEDEGGIFLESIDIFFATKDRYLPVSLYIVETIAGVPGQKRVPYSLVTKDADDIVATYWDDQQAAGQELRYRGNHYSTQGTVLVHADGAEVTTPATPTDFTATNFKFSDPVYLKEGVEYAFVLVSNSNNYNVYISRMGQYDIISNTGIVKQPHLGSLLKSQNTSTWTPDQYADIKFKINRCDFDDSASALYMRINGIADYYDSTAAYAIDDEIIFEDSGGYFGYYICIATTTAGQDPDTNPEKWNLLGDGFYDICRANVVTDDLVIPNTNIVRQYLIDPDSTWIDFTNREDIEMASQRRVYLYTDALAQNTTEGVGDPNGLNLKLQLSTSNTKHSPVINKNRSFAVLVNNLVLTPGADAPAGAVKDAGEYISETTVLKENASSMKMLIDIAKPDDNAIVVPKYRTIQEDIRYVARDSALAADDNLLSDQGGLKDQLAYVYWLDSNMSSSITSVTEKDSVIVDGFDVANGYVYLSSVENPLNFADKTTIGLTGGQEWIFVTTEPDLTTAELNIWTGAGIPADEYAINPSDMNLYRNISGVTSTATPSQNSLDWELVPCVFVDGAVQWDLEVEWRPMTQINAVNPAVDTTQFVEYEFEPTVSPSEEFDNFAIKVEMYSGDAINVPICKRLRVIAVN